MQCREIRNAVLLQQIQQLQSQLQGILSSSLPQELQAAQAAPIQQQIAQLQAQLNAASA